MVQKSSKSANLMNFVTDFSYLCWVTFTIKYEGWVSFALNKYLKIVENIKKRNKH